MSKHRPQYESADYLKQLVSTSERRKRVAAAVKYLRRLQFDAIAFRGMSGALLAPSIANELNKSILMVRKNDDRHSSLTVEGDYGAKTYVIVDDFVCTGHTARTIRDEIAEVAPNAVCLGVLQVNEMRRNTKGLTKVV